MMFPPVPTAGPEGENTYVIPATVFVTDALPGAEQEGEAVVMRGTWGTESRGAVLKTVSF